MFVGCVSVGWIIWVFGKDRKYIGYIWYIENDFYRRDFIGRFGGE